jgi:hypothetical protein
MNISFDVIYYLNLFTATIHLISGAFISIRAAGLNPVIPSNSTRNFVGPYLPAVCYEPPPNGERGRPAIYIEPESAAEAREYITILVVMFFFLSAGFQYAQSLNKNKYRDRVQTNDVNILRYVEYSISASVMMILIACVVGVYDVFTHILVFTCTFLCMILGLFADFFRTLKESMGRVSDSDVTTTNSPDPNNTENRDSETLLKKCIRDTGYLMWGLHWLGWVAILVPYFGVFMVAYTRTAEKSWECLEKQSGVLPDVPGWVTGIIVGQFLLFASFGVVQIVQFYLSGFPNYSKGLVGSGTELAFILLSLIAKSILGWVAAAQIIFA